MPVAATISAFGTDGVAERGQRRPVRGVEGRSDMDAGRVCD